MTPATLVKCLTEQVRKPPMSLEAVELAGVMMLA
jgi:hypothetical protein